MTAYLATLNLNLLSHAFNILWQGQKIEQWQWRFFIIHISDSSLEQKCLIKRVRTWLIASCFPAHSYLTRSFQATGGDVPRLSCVHPQHMWHTVSTQMSKWLQVGVDVCQKPSCDKDTQSQETPTLKQTFFKMGCSLLCRLLPCLMFNMSCWGLHFSTIWRDLGLEGKLAFDMKTCFLSM